MQAATDKSWLSERKTIPLKIVQFARYGARNRDFAFVTCINQFFEIYCMKCLMDEISKTLDFYYRLLTIHCSWLPYTPKEKFSQENWIPFCL